MNLEHAQRVMQHIQKQRQEKQVTEAIVKAESGNGQHAIAVPLLDFSAEQRELIRDTYANGATDSEFAVLMEIAKARRLNPFLRQIHFVKRFNKRLNRHVWAAQTSIDGLRAIAQRTGLYDGQDEPEYEYDERGKIKSCKVRVYRKDWSRPAVGVAQFSEYEQTDAGGEIFWKGKPHVMIAKCAEALGFRKAFPEDMGGLYVPEEMGSDAGTRGDQIPQLPRISPHGEVIDGESYEPVERADEIIRGIEAADTMDALKALWKASGMATPAGYETLHPEDRRRVSASYKRRERQLSKPAKELDQKLEAATAEDDL